MPGKTNREPLVDADIEDFLDRRRCRCSPRLHVSFLLQRSLLSGASCPAKRASGRARRIPLVCADFADFEES